MIKMAHEKRWKVLNVEKKEEKEIRNFWLKMYPLVIRAVRFNLFTLDSNKRKWDQLQTSLL